MRQVDTYTVWAHASGHIILSDGKAVVPAGMLKLMTGPVEDLRIILDGNFDTHFNQNGEPFWSFDPLLHEDMKTGYMMLMKHLAKIRDLYRDMKHVTFFINKAANPEVRRATAQVINKSLY